MPSTLTTFDTWGCVYSHLLRSVSGIFVVSFFFVDGTKLFSPPHNMFNVLGAFSDEKFALIFRFRRLAPLRSEMVFHEKFSDFDLSSRKNSTLYDRKKSKAKLENFWNIASKSQFIKIINYSYSSRKRKTREKNSLSAVYSCSIRDEHK